MLAFLYSFATFFQLGIFWPELQPYKPLVVLSILALIAGLASKVSYPRSSIYGHPAFIFLALFLLVQVISVSYSGIWSLFDEFGFWYQYLAFVVVSTLLITDSRAINNFIWGMIIGCMFIIFYGIYAVYAELPTAVVGRAGAYGMYENHNDYSFIIIMIFPFIYAYFLQKEGGITRLVLLFFLLACVLGILLSLSRGGMIAFVLEGAMLIWLMVDKTKRVPLMLLLIVVGAVGIGYQFSKRAELQGDNYTADDSKSSRFELWTIGANMVISHPLLGVGSRRFGEYSREYGEVSHDNRGKNSHNTYIEILATTGLLGAFMFVSYIRALLGGLRRCSFTGINENLNVIRLATLISIYAILVRSFLDAKVHDWSLYALCSLGLVLMAMAGKDSGKQKQSAREVRPVRTFN
jgi:oligosaccharide repeat unit polymerase